MTLNRVSKRIDGRVVKGYEALGQFFRTKKEAEAALGIKKANRKDKGLARVWHLGMDPEMADSINPILERLRFLSKGEVEPISLRGKVLAVDSEQVMQDQQQLYQRLSASHGANAFTAAQAGIAISQLNALEVRYSKDAYAEFLHCARKAVEAAESGARYIVEEMTLERILAGDTFEDYSLRSITLELKGPAPLELTEDDYAF